MKYPKNRAVFTEIEHTADLGIIVEGETLNRLFANAAYAVINLLYGKRKVPVSKQKQIRLSEGSAEELLISWLSELNYLISVKGFTPAEITDLEIAGSGAGYSLISELRGGRMNDPETEIKAITYHQFYLRQIAGDHYRARIIFDI